MTPQREPEPVPEGEELDEILAREAGMTVEELRSRSGEVDLPPPWEADVVEGPEDSE